MGICISPLIELAQPDVGSDSQKHRQACFQACNGDGGRQAVCPTSLQSMASDMCHWYPLNQGSSTPPPPSVTGWFVQDALLLMPTGPSSNELADQKAFFKGWVHLSWIKWSLTQDVLNCPPLGFSSLIFTLLEKISSEKPRSLSCTFQLFERMSTLLNDVFWIHAWPTLTGISWNLQV